MDGNPVAVDVATTPATASLDDDDEPSSRSSKRLQNHDETNHVKGKNGHENGKTNDNNNNNNHNGNNNYIINRNNLITASSKVAAKSNSIPKQQHYHHQWVLSSRNVKEPHHKEIYGMAWSDNVFSDDDCNGDNNTSTTTTTTTYYTLATCGGNHVTIYETPSTASEGTGAAVRQQQQQQQQLVNSSLRCIQSYVDVDQEESFYACVFAGRCRLVNNHQYHGVEPRTSVRKRPRGQDNNNMTSETNNHSSNWIPSNQPVNGENLSLVEELIDDNGNRNNGGRYGDYVGPLMICAGGLRGVIKVMDPMRQSLVLRLTGHGADIHDLKRSPVDEWKILSASADFSIRLWDLWSATCISIFAGHEGHLGGVLSVSWHASGTKFVSAGLDNSIKIWTVDEQKQQSTTTTTVATTTTTVATTTTTATTTATTATTTNASLPRDNTVHSQKQQCTRPVVRRWDCEIAADPCVQPTIRQVPIFSSTKLHHDYVDCVQFVEDLLLSKSTANTIVLWMPVRKDDPNAVNKEQSKNNHNNNSNGNINNIKSGDDGYAVYRIFPLTDCELWFMRFCTSRDHRLLAIGNAKGKIRIWDMAAREVDAKPMVQLSLPPTQQKQQQPSAIRIVAFSPDQQSLIACCDDSTVWKWDFRCNDEKRNQ